MRSSRVRRLACSRNVVVTRPWLPARVPGFEWESLITPGQDGRPQLMPGQLARLWGRSVRHMFDRVDSPGPWLWRFVVRLGERPHAHRCRRRGLQSMEDCTGQTFLATLLWASLSQHPGAEFADMPSRVSGTFVAGGSTTGRGARTLVCSHH